MSRAPEWAPGYYKIWCDVNISENVKVHRRRLSIKAAYPAQSSMSPLVNLKAINPTGPTHCPISSTMPTIASVKKRHPLKSKALMSDSMPKPWYPCINFLRSSCPSGGRLSLTPTARGPARPAGALASDPGLLPPRARSVLKGRKENKRQFGRGQVVMRKNVG